MPEKKRRQDTPRSDFIIIGAGIVGLAVARSLARAGRSVGVLESESSEAQHQTGHNSGVIHSGLYYKPGSLKARLCVEGRRRLLELCREQSIAHEVCGKLVIATNPEQTPQLDELQRRGAANGLEGLRRLSGEQIAEYEPHARGTAALWVPETGIVDYRQVGAVFARQARAAGAELLFNTRAQAIALHSSEVIVSTNNPATPEKRAAFLINCAGLQCDRVARMCGLRPTLRIVPFRGDYFDLRDDRRHLLRNLIYPVPDPRFPFLGVHLTRRVDGSVEAGPNAVLALRREGYAAPRFSWSDAWSTFSYPGFWRMALRYWRVGYSELLRGGSPRRFGQALREFVPEIADEDLSTGGCGIRAQALARDGRLVDDFAIERGPRMLHVLNAPSPAATAALAIADQIAAWATEAAA